MKQNWLLQILKKAENKYSVLRYIKNCETSWKSVENWKEKLEKGQKPQTVAKSKTVKPPKNFPKP